MATVHYKVSKSLKTSSKFSSFKIGIVTSTWNDGITGALLKAAKSTLLKNGVKVGDIYLSEVPGSFELPLGAKKLYEKYKLHAVISLGCVIKGETKHDDYINQAVANGIMQLNLQYGIPFVFGLLTTNNLKQAKDRAGGKYGNKGEEAALTALKMLV